MSGEIDRYGDGVRKPSGPYDLNILNAMGREQKTALSKLYQEAITQPELYTQHRIDAEAEVIDKMVKKLYQDFQDLLMNGVLNGQQVFKTPSGREYRPRLPEAKITKLSIQVSETLEKILEQAIEECYPKEYGDLAHKKSSEIARAVRN